MNKKSDRIKFTNEAIDICSERGDLRRVYCPITEYARFRNAKIEVTIPKQEDQRHTFSVFAKFTEPREDKGNKYSGKYNFHSTCDVLEAIADFEDHLTDAMA